MCEGVSNIISSTPSSVFTPCLIGPIGSTYSWPHIALTLRWIFKKISGLFRGPPVTSNQSKSRDPLKGFWGRGGEKSLTPLSCLGGLGAPNFFILGVYQVSTTLPISQVLPTMRKYSKSSGRQLQWANVKILPGRAVTARDRPHNVY